MLKSIFASLFLLGLVLRPSFAIANDDVENGYVDKDVMVEVPSAPPAQVTNQNNITVTAPVSGPLASSYPMTPVTQSAHTVSAEASEKSDPEMRMALIPMMGASGYSGAWNYHVTNPYTLGLILEMPASRHFSFELEGSYAKHGISYSYYSHNFDLFGLGGNGKVYLMRGLINPFIGAGVMGLRYTGMTRGPSNPYQTYDHLVGSGQLMAGGDIALSREISIGLRGAFVCPLFNQPTTYHNGVIAYPGYEDASAISTSFVRLMGSVRVAL